MAGGLAAGLLMCRSFNDVLKYFLVHPGGPFFKNKNLGVWSIPKGLPDGKEDLLKTAQREFFEETGIKPEHPLMDIGFITQKGGKVVYAWTFLGTWEPEDGILSNKFAIVWPPGTGKMVEFREVDQGKWMNYSEASRHINPAQIPFLDRAKKIHEV